MTILAKAVQTTPNTEQILYTVPASTEALCSLQICNRDTVAITVRVGLLAAGETVTDTSGFIEYDTTIPANGFLERTGLMLAAGEKISVRSNTATTVNFVVVGKTDAA